MNAKEILNDCHGVVRSITHNTTVFEVVKAMDKFKVGALLCENRKLVGVISEPDYTQKVVLKERASKSTEVSEIMSHKIVQVEPKDSF